MCDKSEPKSDTIPSPSPNPEPEKATPLVITPLKNGGFSQPAEIGVPAATWVKGGTTSSSYDQKVKEDEIDAERRRDEQDADRKLCSVPVEEGGGKMYSHYFGHPKDDPKVLVHYVQSKSDEWGVPILCDVTVEFDGSSRTLVFVCPECVRRGIPQGQAQVRVNDKHRSWSLDERTKGSVIRFGQEIYVSAGQIMDTEVLKCANFNCTLRVRIHKNVMYPV